MFKIGVQTGGLTENVEGLDRAYRIIKESGFDAVDANVDHLLKGDMIRRRERPAWFEGTEEEVLAAFLPWKEAAEKYGLENYQAHAPFPCYVPEPSNGYNDYLLDVLKYTIKGCKVIGCHRLVVHPFFFGYQEAMDPQQEWDVNIARYSALIPTARENDVIICLENMFVRRQGKIYGAICSQMEEACRYIDALNEIAGERRFAFCFDTGHLLLAGHDIKKAMITLGDRIECFHVHDNDGRDDLHMPPYTGVLDWERFMEGLQAIGFNKTLCFETFRIHQLMDPALSPSINRYIHDCGRRFAQQGLRP